jgi:hypothetical protein
MRRLVLAVVAPAILLLAGCGRGPAVTPVEGTVAFSTKKPVNNLLLQFHPLGEVKGQRVLAGSGVTDDAGKFTVKCDDGRDGLPPGKYVVTVIDNNLSTEDEPGAAAKGKRPPNRVGMRYLSADEKNPLQVTVEAGKSGGYDLKLD